MKRTISICLAMMFVVIFSSGFVSCGENQSNSNEILSDDLNKLMFSLDGIVYTLPFHFSELEANGWHPCDYERDYEFATYMLKPDDFDTWSFTNGEHYVVVTISNFSEEILLLSESYVVGVAVRYDLFDAQLILPGNIMIGTSYEYVIEAAGNRFTYIRETEHSVSFRFSIDIDDFTTASFTMAVDNETKQVIFMSMDYFRWD